MLGSKPSCEVAAHQRSLGLVANLEVAVEAAPRRFAGEHLGVDEIGERRLATKAAGARLRGDGRGVDRAPVDGGDDIVGRGGDQRCDGRVAWRRAPSNRRQQR